MKNKDTISVGDRVYLLKEDPECNSIYEVTSIEHGEYELYHPIMGERIVSRQEIELSIY